MEKRGLQLTRICLLPPTPQFIGGHLTGSVARRSTFFIFRVPLMVPVVGFEPTRGCPHLILSQARLPFHHTGRLRILVSFRQLSRTSAFKGLQSPSAASRVLFLPVETVRQNPLYF